MGPGRIVASVLEPAPVQAASRFSSAESQPHGCFYRVLMVRMALQVRVNEASRTMWGPSPSFSQTLVGGTVLRHVAAQVKHTVNARTVVHGVSAAQRERRPRPRAKH